MSLTSPHHDADNSPPKLEENVKVANFTPRQLNIVWGNDPRYWKIPEKNSSGAAELLQVCWLEVSGNVPIGGLSRGDKYKISFEVSLKSDAFGWNNCPVYVMAKFGKKGTFTWKKILLQSYGSEKRKIPAEDLDLVANDKDISGQPDTIYFGLYEVWSGKWKGGLLLHSAKVEKAPTN